MVASVGKEGQEEISPGKNPIPPFHPNPFFITIKQ